MTFTLKSNFYHFMEFHFTSVLHCEVLLMPDPGNFSDIIEITKKYLVFHSKSQKFGEIIIRRVHGSHKW